MSARGGWERFLRYVNKKTVNLQKGRHPSDLQSPICHKSLIRQSSLISHSISHSGRWSGET